ncbi:MAG: hypothetical protein CBD18_09300 [Opitutales bacterium TMED158]|nr:MAG: hypothetical protein CBD18_09300 [Opitutales bacterium TMED158]
MKTLIAITVAFILGASAAFADVIVTKSGSTINGKIQGIDSGKITVATDFAGEIAIDQAQVESIATDEPIFVSLESGASYVGTLTGDGGRSLTVDTQDGEMKTSIDKLTESWQPGVKSPTEVRRDAEMEKLKRKWGYQAAFDMTGKSGNSDSTGLGMSFRATLQGPDDKLEFFSRANFEETDGSKSADDARAGVDYSNQINDDWNWYISSELGRDVIKDTDLFVSTAAGFGYNIANTETRFINVRGGIGYRFENYSVLGREELSAASLDFGLEHKETLKWGKLVNRIKFTPTVEEFGSFRLFQDTAFDLPLKAERYSVRVGFSNDYDADADLSGKDELDTTYYIRLVLNWD